MLSRRDLLQLAAATAALPGALTGVPSGLNRALAQQKITQDDLLRFEPLGQVTLLHLADIHAQLVPLYFREPSVNLGVGAARGKPPHLTGGDFLREFGLAGGTAEAHALTSENYAALAKSYGKVGGVDRLATLIGAVRAERPGKTLLLDGGDTWQGSYTSLATRGADMVEVMNALKVEAMTAHWEFTYGAERVEELIGELGFPFLAGNVRDTEWDEEVFDAVATFERGGVKIAVIGQAFPYTPVAHPIYKMPNWSFGIRESLVRKRVEQVRAEGAELVVLLSHNGFDTDRKLAGRIEGLDVLLSAHTHDAVPIALEIDGTLMISSGSHGKFLSRLDLEVKGGRVADYRFRLIPVLSDAIAPDPEMAALVGKIRAPFDTELGRVLGRTEGLLYRRGNFNGTFDDLICQALIEERDAEIALSPGFRWGATLLPGQDITVEDIYSQTAITYPNAYRIEFTGAFLKDILEDVADNLFNPDPYYQQGGDMVRVGGMAYAIDIAKPIGQRISEMTLIRSGKPIEADKSYMVSGWASVNEGTEGPPVYDVLARHIERHQVIDIPENQTVRVVNS
jgi:sulfur-oxidizing protein SoxB